MRRLVQIRQIGIAWIGFPGAHHTVLEHVLGTYYLSKKIVQYIGKNAQNTPIPSEDQQLLGVAILLSRIHVEPLRHVFWDIADRREDKSSDLPVTAKNLINNEGIESEVHKCLKKYWKSDTNTKIESIVNINWRKEGNNTSSSDFDYLKPLIRGSPITLNWLDNVPRDAYYSGIGSSSISSDSINIFQNSYIANDGIVLSDNAIIPVETLLISRIHQYSQLYSNEDVIVPQKMLIKAIVRYCTRANVGLSEFRNKIIRDCYSDEELILYLGNQFKMANDNVGKRIIDSIFAGQLYNPVFPVRSWLELTSAEKDQIVKLFGKKKEIIKYESQVADKLGIENSRIIIDFDRPQGEPRNTKNVFVSKNSQKINIFEMLSIFDDTTADPFDSNRKILNKIIFRNWFFGVYLDPTLKIPPNKINKVVTDILGIAIQKGETK